MRNYPVLILNDVDTGSKTGDGIFVGQAVAASFSCIFGDATAAGTVKIQGSNEPPVGDPAAYTPTTASFADITNATSAIASGVGPAIVLTTMNFQYIRAVFTRSGGGSTTVKVYMSALGV